MTPVLRFHRTGSRGSTPPCRTHRFADPPGRMPEGPEPRGRLGRPRSPTDRRMAPPPVTSRQANGGRRNRHEPNASAEPTSGAAPNPCPFKLISARADPLNEYALRYGPVGDTPSVPRLRWQLWALRPGLDGASRPSTTPTGRGRPPDSGWRAGREPVGVGVKRRRQAGGLGSAWSAWCRVRGTSGRRWRPTRGGGRPCCSPQTHTNADLLARSTPRAAACSGPE